MPIFVPRDAFALKIQRELSPEMCPKSFGTFEKRVPGLQLFLYFPTDCQSGSTVIENANRATLKKDFESILTAFTISFQKNVRTSSVLAVKKG